MSKSKFKSKTNVTKGSKNKSIPAAENNILDLETQTEIQDNIPAADTPVLNTETKSDLLIDPTDILSNFKISKANKSKFYKIADKMHISQEELLKLAIKAVNNKKVEFTTKSVYVIK